jgi:glycine cleavage system transcriptional repressor
LADAASSAAFYQRVRGRSLKSLPGLGYATVPPAGKSRNTADWLFLREDAMQNRFIMTAFGKDRPGIVADVTRILFENDCNLEDTAMTLLADEFTLNLLFSSHRRDLEKALAEECQRLEQDRGIAAFIRPLPERQELKPTGVAHGVLHVEGLDQAGIVYRVSRHLADHALNITDLKSTVRASPESGTPLYLMDIHIQVPPGTALEQVERGLLAVADELNVEISLSPLPG